MNTLIEVKDLSFRYGQTTVLEHINLEVEAGEFLGVVGPNGGGKTTLLKLLLGLLAPTAGSIRIAGQPPASGRRLIGYCPQHIAFPRDFPISVEETVLLGLLRTAPSLWSYNAAERAAMERALAITELSSKRRFRLSALSGGELQRVMLARTLVSKPKILLLDEPTANIDHRVEEDIFELLRQLNAAITIIVVSHDIGFISGYVTRVACVNRTLICHRTTELTGDAVDRLYGRHVQMIQHAH